MFIIELLTLINPHALGLSLFFENGLKCFSFSFTFLFYPTIFTEHINNRKQIILHFNKVCTPYFINLIYNNTSSSKIPRRRFV